MTNFSPPQDTLAEKTTKAETPARASTGTDPPVLMRQVIHENHIGGNRYGKGNVFRIYNGRWNSLLS